MFCPNCGAANDGSSKFCPSCGAQIPGGGAQREEPYYQQQPHQQPYQQPQRAPQGGYRVPIENRSIGMCIVLSIVTCGIYCIYWQYRLINDLNLASESTDAPSGGTVIVLSLVTCSIYMYYWLYKAGEKVGEVQRRNGQTPDSNAPLLYMLLGIFGLGIVSVCLIQSELNKVAMT